MLTPVEAGSKIRRRVMHDMLELFCYDQVPTPPTPPGVPPQPPPDPDLPPPVREPPPPVPVPRPDLPPPVIDDPPPNVSLVPTKLP